MKLEDFYQIQDLKEQQQELAQAIINTEITNVEDAKKLVANDFQAEKNSAYEGFDPDFDNTEAVENLAQEEITDLDKALEVESIYFDGQSFINNEVEEYEEVSEQLENLIDDAEKIIKIVDDIESKGFTIKYIDHSSKSLSTYLTLPVDELDDFMDEYLPDDSSFELKEDEKYFGVRISDHDSGMRFLKDQFRYIVYPNNYLNLDFNEFY